MGFMQSGGPFRRGIALANSKGMKRMTAHEILGIPEDASVEDVRFAYHTLARELHPDVGGEVEEFLNLHRAYEILKSHEKAERLGSIPIFRSKRKGRSAYSENVFQLLENMKALGLGKRKLN